VFLIGVGYVVAYGGTQPAVMGHDIGEIAGVQAKINSGLTTCSGVNKAIKTINPATGVVTCETDDNTDTDTRCDTSGRCSQVCIGTICKSAWDAAICTWNSKTYSTGYKCYTGICGSNTEGWVCTSSGGWASASVMCSAISKCGV